MATLIDGVRAIWQSGGRPALATLSRLGLSLALTGAMASCGGGGDGEAAPAGTARLSAVDISTTARAGEVAPVQSINVTAVGVAAGVQLYAGIGDYSRNGLLSVDMEAGSASSATVLMYFKAPADLAPGSYSDTVDVVVCFDAQCRRHLQGSPARVRTAYTVQTGSSAGGGGGGGGGGTGPVTPEPGLAALPVEAQTALPHDVVDAEFSRALNAVVMVASWPEPLLVVRDAVSGVTRQARLPKLPRALSISPDGLTVAVGHDALVSHFRLADLALAPTLLNVSANVGDLVLDGQGRVHVFPATDQWVSVHSIDVATNTERLQYGPRAGTRVRLHPNGTSIYGANNGLSPDDIEHYDVTAGTGLRLRDSPYHGDYAMCGNLWLSENGATIFTACGNTFRASMDAAQDMRYTGALALSSASNFGFRVRSLSAPASRREVVLLEEPWYDCTVLATSGCVSRLAVHDGSFFGRTAVYSVPPVAVAGGSYRQLGLHVFHRNDGVRVLISRLSAMPNPAAEFLWGLVR